MTEKARKAKLQALEKQWEKEWKKCKKYSLLLKGAQDRKYEIEKAIKNL